MSFPINESYTSIAYFSPFTAIAGIILAKSKINVMQLKQQIYNTHKHLFDTELNMRNSEYLIIEKDNNILTNDYYFCGTGNFVYIYWNHAVNGSTEIMEVENSQKTEISLSVNKALPINSIKIEIKKSPKILLESHIRENFNKIVSKPEYNALFTKNELIESEKQIENFIKSSFIGNINTEDDSVAYIREVIKGVLFSTQKIPWLENLRMKGQRILRIGTKKVKPDIVIIDEKLQIDLIICEVKKGQIKNKALIQHRNQLKTALKIQKITEVYGILTNFTRWVFTCYYTNKKRKRIFSAYKSDIKSNDRKWEEIISWIRAQIILAYEAHKIKLC